MGESIKNLLLQQIRLKLQLVDGEVKKSKVQKINTVLATFLQQSVDRQVEISSSVLPKWSTWHVIPNKNFPPPPPATLPPPLHLPPQMT